MIVEEIGTDHARIGARAARHFEIAFRRIMTGAGSVQKTSYLRLVTGEAHPMGNLAIVSEPGNLGAALEATAPLLTCGASAAAVFPRGVDDAVARAVRELGFRIEAMMPAMAVDIDRMAATTLPPGYDWARIGAGDDGRAWAEALAIGYEIPRPLANLFAPEALGADMAPDAQIQFYAVLHEGRQVATSMLFLADGLAGIYCVSTRPEERNKGLGAHATAGYKVYQGLGFGTYARMPMLIHVT